MPCTRCFRGNKRCVMSADSSRCNKCIWSKKSCDGMRVASLCKSFLAALLFSRLAAAAGYLLRICKIKSRVRKKRSEATRRGLQEVEQ
ncbi:hypothetical protein HZ326_31705 [Fusarium oxysporum f. sp. albedinis]|nr:hypothetical protein HZ326_31705 [Fusarium oxysporum f. sp. albedinis]